jgi:hypothetical protein
MKVLEQDGTIESRSSEDICKIDLSRNNLVSQKMMFFSGAGRFTDLLPMELNLFIYAPKITSPRDNRDSTGRFQSSRRNPMKNLLVSFLLIVIPTSDWFYFQWRTKIEMLNHRF